ncbi:uncharacterized protein SOCE26_059290 [Sorangium cellulosum]|uniref:Uncharacterized protein n=1 Tax=Sorangium cellulosum TaxID=56 RepID=A0A2L0EYX3_SORCE|nr:hypothetical protein [Sorangium cellulosum]AUX44465.1 uncharacterized protein SOCE26_059290 [Sorangium cellulosum]
MYGRTLPVAALALALAEVRYGNPRLGFVYGLVETPPIDVGAKVSATLNTGPTGNLIAPLSAGVPVAVRMAGSLRIDAGAFVNVGLGRKEDEKNTMGLSVPVSPSVQIAPPITVAVDTGFSIADLRLARRRCRSRAKLVH